MTTADVAVPSPPPRRRRRRRDPNVPRRLLRVVFVLFVLSMPIESLKFSWMPETLTFTKILGYVFIVLSLMQRRVVFRRPRPAVVFFWMYGLVIALFVVTRPAPGGASYLMQLIQWLTLLWAASNLLTGADLRRSTLFAFYVGCVVLAGTQEFGGAVLWVGERAGVLTENPNTVGALFAIAVIAGVGWFREYSAGSRLGRLFVVATMPFLAYQMVRTQSRGAMLALGLGALTYALTAQRFSGKLKMAVVGGILLATLGGIVLQSDLARERWTVVLSERTLGGREFIYPVAWQMIKERPIAGWGPVGHFYELGFRTGEETMEEHNLLLFIFAEGGALAAVPYLLGLMSAGLLALRARGRGVGITALALLITVGGINVSNVFHNRKIQWMVFAFAIASAPVAVRRRREVGSPSVAGAVPPGVQMQAPHPSRS